MQSHGSQVSAYFRSDKLEAPSYTVKVGGKYFIRSNRENLKSLFKVENGLVTSAFVEKWYPEYRVSILYELKDGKYQIAKSIVTNRGIFLSMSPSDSSENKCSMSESDVSKLANVVASTEYINSFVDSSCSSLSPVKKIALSKLKQSLVPNSNEGKSLLDCLGKLSREVKNEKTRDRIIDLWASIVAIMKRQIDTGEPGLKISCADSTKIGGTSRCEANKGNVVFPIQDGDIAVAKNQLQQKFVHELVHRSRPLVVSNDYEEKFSDYIASTCTGQYSDKQFVELDETPKQTGESLKKVPLPVKDAVAKIRPQKIETGTVDSLEKLATSKLDSSSKSNSNALAAAYDDAVAEPVKTFSSTTDTVARAFIPSANAAVESYSGSTTIGSNSSGNDSNSSRRSPASTSESSFRPFEVTKTSGFGKIPQSKERVVEEILVNRGDNNVLSAKTTVTAAEAPNVTIGRELKIQETKAETLSELARNSSTGGGSPTVNLDSVSVSTGSNITAQVSRRNVASVGRASEPPSIGGIITLGNNVTGANYQRFRNQIADDSGFKASLEQAGVLISRGGVLLSRPKQVNATYIDNGSSLIFAN